MLPQKKNLPKNQLFIKHIQWHPVEGIYEYIYEYIYECMHFQVFFSINNE